MSIEKTLLCVICLILIDHNRKATSHDPAKHGREKRIAICVKPNVCSRDDDATLWCQETDSRDAAHSSYLALLELINGATNAFQVARSH